MPAGAAARRRVERFLGGLAIAPLMMAASASLYAAPPPDAKQIVAAQCAACHTDTGNSIAPPFPKLAGMSPDYLAKQLRDFSSGQRKSEIMYPIASQLKRGEINALAAYFGGQTRTQGIVSDPSLIPAGEIVFHQGNKESGVPACASCHTKTGAGAPRFPMIASQNAEYVVQQLQGFRSGARGNDFGKLMRTVTSRLTDQEIRAVAQYVASMPVPSAAR